MLQFVIDSSISLISIGKNNIDFVDFYLRDTYFSLITATSPCAHDQVRGYDHLDSQDVMLQPWLSVLFVELPFSLEDTFLEKKKKYSSHVSRSRQSLHFRIHSTL